MIRMLRIGPLVFYQTIVLGVFLFLNTAYGQGEKLYDKPNIILIMVDDMGYGDLGCYGQELIHTPQIDALARAGMRFTQFYSGSTVCAPSRESLLTGKHTGHTFVRGNFNPDGQEDLTIPLTTRTMAEYFKDAGYHTALIGKWGLGRAGYGPNHQGFDYSFGYLNQMEAHSYYPEVLWENEEQVTIPENAGDQTGVYSHDVFVEKALDYIGSANPEQPYFLYLPLTIPHGKYEVPDDTPYSGKPWSQRDKNLAAMITRLDGDVGRIVEAVKSNGNDENTLILFTSDNGAGQPGDETFDRNGAFRGYKRDLYEGGIRVPMIIWGPGRIEAGQVTDHTAAAWDILPTLSELAGFQVENSDGISMVPTLTGNGRQAIHDFLYWEYYTYNWGWKNSQNDKPRNWFTSQAIRMGQWKVIHNHIQDPNQVSWEVYNLKTDPEESRNLASEFPDVLQQARTYMREAGKQSSPYFPYVSYAVNNRYDTPFDFKNGRELMQFLRPNKGRLLITSHRGDKMAGFAENSIACFAKTLEYAPVMFETDPRYTKDSVVILFHDSNLDRTSNGTGKVSDYTWAELQELYLTDPYGNITPYRIPTLDEALEWARGKTILFLDNKDVPVEVRAQKILEHQATGHAVIMAYSLADARKVYDISPDIMVQVFVPDEAGLKKLKATGIPLDNVIAFVTHKWPEGHGFLQKLQQEGILPIVGSSRTIDRYYLSGEMTYDEMMEKYQQLRDLGPGVVEADSAQDAWKAVQEPD